MPSGVRVMVLAGNGINCEMETTHAFRLAGADQVDIVYIWELAAGKANLAEGYQMLCLPGGFLDGDDLGSARASAIRIQHTQVGEGRLFDQLRRFVDDGGLIIGICNGFQLMVKLGLLPALDGDLGTQQVTLTWNDSGRFEDRWVRLGANTKSHCIFTRDIEQLDLPVRHGEGKLVTRDNETLARLFEAKQIPLSYVDPATGEPTTDYPQNPNGSPHGIAALTDPSGRLFGLMPHPEAYLHRTNHPQWTRSELPEEGAGVRLFRNGIEFIRQGN